MPVRDVSVENYLEGIYSGRIQTQRARIHKALLEQGPLTRHEMAKVTGIPLQSVCGAAKTLIDSELAFEHPDPIPDPVTGNTARKVEAVQPKPVQAGFAWFAQGRTGPP